MSKDDSLIAREAACKNQHRHSQPFEESHFRPSLSFK